MSILDIPGFAPQQQTGFEKPSDNLQQNSPSKIPAQFQQQQSAVQSPEPPQVDKWEELYKIDQDDKSKSGQEKTLPTLQSSGLTVENIGEISKKVNFNLPSDEDIKNIFEKGDVGAFKGILESVGRQAFQTSLAVATQSVDKVSGQANEYQQENLSKIALKQNIDFEVSQTISAEFPQIENNPSLLLAINDVKNRMAAKYPKASPKQIAQMLAEYAEDRLGFTRASKLSKQTSTETDWDDF